MNQSMTWARALHGTCVGLILAAGSFLLGCAAETGPFEPSSSPGELPHLPEQFVASLRSRRTGPDKPFTEADRARVLDILRRQGHDVTGAVFFAEDAVRIEGDLLFDGPTVLQDALLETKKGNWFGPPEGLNGYNVLGGNTVRVAWGTPPDDWGWAFALGDAIADLNNNTNLHFTFDGPAWMPTVVVSTFAHANWGIALSQGGHDAGNPAPVAINTAYIGRIASEPLCYWKDYHTIDYQIKRRVMRHEILHSIGFAHEGDPSAPHIPGTAVGGSTIMYAGECWPGPYDLTLEDSNMVNTIYFYPPL